MDSGSVCSIVINRRKGISIKGISFLIEIVLEKQLQIVIKGTTYSKNNITHISCYFNLNFIY